MASDNRDPAGEVPPRFDDRNKLESVNMYLAAAGPTVGNSGLGPSPAHPGSLAIEVRSAQPEPPKESWVDIVFLSEETERG